MLIVDRYTLYDDNCHVRVGPPFYCCHYFVCVCCSVSLPAAAVVCLSAVCVVKYRACISVGIIFTISSYWYTYTYTIYRESRKSSQVQLPHPFQ